MSEKSLWTYDICEYGIQYYCTTLQGLTNHIWITGNLTEIITEDNNQSNFRVAELSPTFYINNTIPDQRS